MTKSIFNRIIDDAEILSKMKDLDMGEIISIEAIQEEASHRKYYRLQMSGIPQTAILCDDLPLPYNDEDHFIELSGFLKKRGYPCSEILIDDSKNGRLILKDAGNLDLSTAINQLDSQTESSKRGQLINQAIDLIFPLQKFEAPKTVKTRSFDSEKLQWEMEYLFKHVDLISVFLDIKNPITFEMKNFIAKMCNKLDQKKDLVMCHRDYHGRNIILNSHLSSRDLTIIDFQDARMGLPVYDAVSLIYDPYTPLTRQEKFTAKAYFESLLAPEHKRFKPYFYLQAVQRLLKALGTYCNQIFIKNNTKYIDTLPIALSNLEEVIQLGHIPDCIYLFANHFRRDISPNMEKISGKYAGKSL